jgi:uncharacterized membrane protein required for colicin V production
MNVLFLVAVALIALFTLIGIKVGLIRRVIEFAGLIITFLVATNLAPHWHEFVADNTGLEPMVALYVTWFVIFLVGLVLTRLLAWSLGKVLRISVIGWLDRLGGAALGFLIGLILTSVVLIGISQLPGGEVIRESFTERPVPRFVYQAAPTLVELFRKLGGDEQQIWDNLIEEVKKRTDISAHTPTSAETVATPG